jgi:hypothetical protein
VPAVDQHATFGGVVHTTAVPLHVPAPLQWSPVVQVSPSSHVVDEPSGV